MGELYNQPAAAAILRHGEYSRICLSVGSSHLEVFDDMAQPCLLPDILDMGNT